MAGAEHHHAATKACRVCGEDIKFAAVKCIHCNGWQDWRSGLAPVGTTVLPLLIALISVSIAALPIVADALTPKASILTGSFQADSQEFITVLVSNSGGLSGSVSGAVVEFPDYGHWGVWQFPLHVVTPDNSDAMLIASKQASLVRLGGEGVGRHLTPTGKDITGYGVGKDDLVVNRTVETSECNLILKYTKFDGSPQLDPHKVACTLLHKFSFVLTDIQQALPQIGTPNRTN